MKEIKTIRGLASELAKREGLKSQAAIGNVREILGHLSDMVFDERHDGSFVGIPCVLYDNGANRAKRKPKQKK